MLMINNNLNAGWLGFWKIWKDDIGLQFYIAEKYNSTDDNTL